MSRTFCATPRGPIAPVVLTGGVRTPSDALAEPVAVYGLRRLHLDLVFLGVHGMADGAGFTTPNLTESETNRVLVKAGRRLVVLAGHAKWGIVGISTIDNLDEANIVVTDDGLAEPARQILAEHVDEFLIAGVEDADGDGAD